MPNTNTTTLFGILTCEENMYWAYCSKTVQITLYVQQIDTLEWFNTGQLNVRISGSSEMPSRLGVSVVVLSVRIIYTQLWQCSWSVVEGPSYGDT